MFIIPRQPSIGEVLGEGLADLAKTWGERHTATQALKSLGFNDSQARAYANLGPQFQQQAIQSLMNQQQQEKANAAINQILGTGLGAAQPQQQYQFAPAPQAQQSQQGLPRQMLPYEQQEAAIQQAT